MENTRKLIRHTLATVAYRATRAIEAAPDSFGDFAGCGKTPAEILAHIGDLFDWALSLAKGEPHWHASAPLAWTAEKGRFFAAIEAFDAYLASAETVHAPLDKLLQGPIADALTHVGQLAMLRRLAGAKMQGENYYVANIETGNVSARQPTPVRTF